MPAGRRPGRWVNAATRVEDLHVSFRQHRIHMAPILSRLQRDPNINRWNRPIGGSSGPPPLPLLPQQDVAGFAPGGERSHSPVPDFHFLFPLMPFFKVAFRPRRRRPLPHGPCVWRLPRRRPLTPPLVHVSVGFSEARREVLLGNRHHQPAALERTFGLSCPRKV